MVCRVCKGMAATSEEAYLNRMSQWEQGRKQDPNFAPGPCYSCKTTDWATTRKFIVMDRIPRPWYRRIPTEVWVLIAFGLAVVAFALLWGGE